MKTRRTMKGTSAEGVVEEAYTPSNPPPYPVVPNGSYPNMTAGKATNVTNQINGKAVSDIFESDGVTTKKATNVTTNINGKAISSIFESNGTTVKKATNATKATQDANGNVITSTYAKKTELPEESELVPSPPTNPDPDDVYVLRYRKNDNPQMRWRLADSGNLSFVGVTQNSSEFNTSTNGLSGWLIMRNLDADYITNGTLWGHIYDSFRYSYIPFIGRYREDNGTTHPICAIYCVTGGDFDDPRIVAYGSDGFAETIDTKDYQWAYSLSRSEYSEPLGWN